MQNRVNSFTGFQPLKEVWLGDCYPESFYNHLPSAVQDAFGIITEWTKQDLAHIQSTLEHQGVIVRRPKFTNNINDYVLNDQLLKPPITPRDDSMTLGNEFYHLRSRYQVDPWAEQLADFVQHGTTIHIQADGPLACLHPPSIVRIGQDIYIDYDTHEHVWNFISPTLIDWARRYRVHVCSTGGHSDGVFCPIAPNIIVATHYLSQYDKTFPDWQVLHLPKSRNNGFFGAWHVDDTTIMKNQGFAEHINRHAMHWVGNYRETVFEANMLVINPTHVLAIKESPLMFKWLQDRGITVTLCDFRCRSFWDGGLHCLTTDILREGTRENYFPQRLNMNYLDWLC